jgi:hypothetical protein
LGIAAIDGHAVPSTRNGGQQRPAWDIHEVEFDWLALKRRTKIQTHKDTDNSLARLVVYPAKHQNL